MRQLCGLQCVTSYPGGRSEELAGNNAKKYTLTETLFPKARQVETPDTSAAYDLVVFNTAGGVTGVDHQL
jgi:hypothetical protein